MNKLKRFKKFIDAVWILPMGIAFFGIWVAQGAVQPFQIQMDRKIAQAKPYLPKKPKKIASTEFTRIQNQTFLAQVKNFDEKDEPLLANDKALKLRQEYEDRFRNYNEREKYGLLSPYEKDQKNDQVADFSEYVLRKLFDYQVNSNMKKMEKKSDEVRFVAKVHKSVQTVAKGTDVSVNQDVKVITKADIPRKEGKIWMESKVFNLGLNMDLKRKIENLDDVSENSNNRLATPFTMDDKYKISLWREIPLLEVDSDLAYALSYSRFRATFKKKLANHLTGEFSQTRQIGVNSLPQDQQKENKISLNYGVSF